MVPKGDHASLRLDALGLFLAGLLLLPSAFTTASYPRWLAWLGLAEWGIAALATGLLVLAPDSATGPLLISFALYAPWVWGSALWLLRADKPSCAFLIFANIRPLPLYK